MGQKKILIVDDDVSFVESNKDLLEAFGYEVYTAYDGQSGLEMAHKVRPDIMILDVMMASETEGFEIARKVPESPELKDTRILLVTGVTHALNLPFPLQPDKTWLPVDRVLEKPIPPDRLIAELERAMKPRT
jgi:two-component system, OmpR family, alkaline phosphatase synthesis response regulator PhoP